MKKLNKLVEEAYVEMYKQPLHERSNTLFSDQSKTEFNESYVLEQIASTLEGENILEWEEVFGTVNFITKEKKAWLKFWGNEYNGTIACAMAAICTNNSDHEMIKKLMIHIIEISKGDKTLFDKTLKGVVKKFKLTKDQIEQAKKEPVPNHAV